MISASTNTQLHFDIHPSVVFQLGDGLITDSVQALVELIKNAYDADASYASVSINTGENEHPLSRYKGTRGYIVIKDNGHGMSLDVIRRGWLTISNSPKREMKRLNMTTAKGRVPLGDKGLGRLGAQRLGTNVEIVTKVPGQNDALYVAYSWADFVGREVLTEVPVVYDEIQMERESGTTLIISGLYDIDTWQGDSTIELQKNLSRMICPYEEVPGFRLVIICDGRKLELTEISRRVREVAPLHYDIVYHNGVLTLSGRIRTSFLRRNDKDERMALNNLLDIDGGQSFLEFLASKPSAWDRYRIKRSETPGWFIEFSQDTFVEDLPMEKISGKIADQGPFRGDVDSFDLSSEASKQQEVFSRAADFKSYVKELSGIGVYRDGFAIRVDPDWLKLGSAWTTGGSYYGLKPINTLGYIALTAGMNGVLEETTDREGFKHTPYYKNFHILLQEFVDFSSRVQEFIRRSAGEYLQFCRREEAEVDEATTPEDLARELADGITDIQTIGIRLQRVEDSFTKSMDDTQSALRDAKSGLTEEISYKQMVDRLEELVAVLEARMPDARSCIADLRLAIDKTGPLVARGGVLMDQIVDLRDQLQQMYETIGLGLTAEALSHETDLIADGLARRANKLSDHLQKKGICDAVLMTFLEHVKSTVSTLRKQLSYMDPSLRYVRERKDRVIMSEFLKEFADFKQARAQQKNISIKIDSHSNSNFAILMNIGKLRQVLDNLYMNSEYWLSEAIHAGEIENGVIRIELSTPFLRFSDNGRGVDRRVESSLFEPFMTTKPREVGRGLGLYISRQLLDAEGCSITLLPHRNEYDRRYIFQIDLCGGITG